MKCEQCPKEAEEGRKICFNCRIRTVGIGFVGGGGYGRKTFHDRTIGEFIRENVGDVKEKKNLEPVHRGCWT